ncbi:hypothetical protein [Cellulomonas triticagri]|uniref:Uncharacterized protein n=1 Tax=Cellulomonas triticagri TaxID=2483352 RepID=A0A3M2J5V8_9CELL|nr:hypothetical protein [Cellulomonas triticagri]RMI09497.1 hypothetical protein EBM89_09955 [Cellulomonas triticagri]
MRRLYLVGAVALIGVSACVAGWATAQTNTDGTDLSSVGASDADPGRHGVELTATNELPRVVPSLTVDETTIEPLYLSWHQPGQEARTITPSSGATAADYPTVDLDTVLEASLDSTVPPAVVNARFYHRLGPDGLPADAEDSHLECLSPNPRCTVRATRTGIDLRIDADPAAVFTVIEIFYHNPGIAPEPPFSIATYGFNANIDRSHLAPVVRSTRSTPSSTTTRRRSPRGHVPAAPREVRQP